MGLLIIGKTSVNIDGNELDVERMDIDFALTNGCEYDSVTAGDGNRKYNLQKDPFVRFENDEQGEMVLTAMNVPGGKNEASIKKLQGYLADTVKEKDHSGYAKPVTICFINAAGEKTFSINFLGCVSEIENIPADTIKAAQYKITLLVVDMDTLNFES